jgi:hypothetical protein
MVGRSRLLSRAIKSGESALRSALREMQARRGEISNALRYCDKETCSDDVIQARLQICELDQLIARLRTVQTALATVLQLGID